MLYDFFRVEIVNDKNIEQLSKKFQAPFYQMNIIPHFFQHLWGLEMTTVPMGKTFISLNQMSGMAYLSLFFLSLCLIC